MSGGGRLRSALALPLLLLFGASASAAVIGGFRYSRPVIVTDAGRVRIPLDLAAVQHSAPDLSDVRLYGPGGEPVAFDWTVSPPRPEPRPVEVASVSEEEGHWVVLFDAGPSPPHHDLLRLELGGGESLAACRLEGSADRASWQLLAAGELSAPAGHRAVEVAYPTSEDRYLRLSCLRAEGGKEPTVTAAEVEALPGPALAVTAFRVQCDHELPSTSVCRLPLAAPGQTLRRLTLRSSGGGDLAYRLHAPAEGRWQLLAEGREARSGGESVSSLELGEGPLAGDFLRLELYDTGNGLPRITAYTADFSLRCLELWASAAGSYTLAYGALSPPPPATEPARGPTSGQEARWAEVGSEEERPLVALPATLIAPAARLPEVRFRASWQLQSSAAAGDVVRLELPEEVYAFARRDLGDLRLAVGDREVPFLVEAPPAPALVWQRAGMVPPPAEGDAARRLDLPAMGRGLHLTELSLSSPGPSPRFRLRLVAVPPQREENDAGGREITLARHDWSCSGPAGLPCRSDLALDGPPGGRLLLAFEAGGGPPPPLDLSLWRRRDLLVFAWPADGPISLLAGAADLARPDAPSEELSRALRTRPWRPATLAAAGPPPVLHRGTGGWVLVAAGLVLIALLAVQLRSG